MSFKLNAAFGCLVDNRNRGENQQDISLAQLEAHAQKFQTSDEQRRSLPRVFSAHVSRATCSAVLLRAQRETSAAAERTPSGGESPWTLCGLRLLRDVYDEGCVEYLESNGVLELLDALAVADVVHCEQQRYAGVSSNATRGGDGEALEDPSMEPRSPSALTSSAVTAQMCPTLPLVRAVERWRLTHPSPHSLDAVHRRVWSLWQDIISTITSKDFLVSVESLRVVKRPKTSITAALRGTRRASLGSSSNALTTVTSSADTCAAAQHEDDDTDDATGLSDPSLQDFACCGYSIDPEYSDKIETMAAVVRRIELKIMELSDGLQSLDAAERALVMFPWSRALQTPSASLLGVHPDLMRTAMRAVQCLLQTAHCAYEILRQMMQHDKSWVLCLNDNLEFLKKETTCSTIPRLSDQLGDLLASLHGYRTGGLAETFPHVQWLLQQSTLLRDAEWVYSVWRRSQHHLVYLQRLLVAQIETFTIVTVTGDDGQPQHLRQITTTPTTRYDRVYSERRSVVAWGALTMRSSFRSWAELRETPLHRIAQQLKKMSVEKKTTFEVVMVLLGQQLDLAAGAPVSEALGLFDRPEAAIIAPTAPNSTLMDFLDEERTMFQYEARHAKFTSATVVRK